MSNNTNNYMTIQEFNHLPRWSTSFTPTPRKVTSINNKNANVEKEMLKYKVTTLENENDNNSNVEKKTKKQKLY
jgi:hypothetical protein